MQVHLSEFMRLSPDGREAEAALRKCVHCGLCNATCPTHQLLGDELDGPRGRIYLIKEALEGGAVSPQTRLHLDRCLTCRACETTCPSSVPYGRLAEIGRRVVDKRLLAEGHPRPWRARLLRALLREGLTRPRLFGFVLALARMAAPALPSALRLRIPRVKPPGRRPRATRAHRLVLAEGCVQPALAPNINAATARVFDAVGVQCVSPPGRRCCGAIRYHLGDHDGGLADMRANIDAWLPLLDAGAQGILVTASGCGQMIAEYGAALQHDRAYAAKARRVSDAVLDAAEALLPHLGRLASRPPAPGARSVAFHSPCTLQHGMRVKGAVEQVLAAVGVTSRAPVDSHLCCGSAGTYSILQPDIATALRDDKLSKLQQPGIVNIVTANIGCQIHLQGGTPVPVQHWIEFVDEWLSLPH